VLVPRASHLHAKTCAPWTPHNKRNGKTASAEVLLDLSAWYDPSQRADIDVDPNDALEIIELDNLLTRDLNQLTATSLVAFVGIWLNWHNLGNYRLHSQLSLVAPKFQRVPGY